MPQTISFSSRRLILAWTVAALGLIPLAGGLAARYGEKAAMEEISAVGEGRAELYRAHLLRELEHPVGLPLAIARHPAVVRALKAGSKASPEPLNRLLADLATAGDLSDLYVMDATGLTIAASNWDGPTSFVGRNFGFRDYFTMAMQGHMGRDFALGTTSNQPGYYLSQPVRDDDGRILGVVVAKVQIQHMEKSWAGNPERVLVTDAKGVVIITDADEMRFRTLGPIPAEGRFLLPVGGRHVAYMVRSLDVPEAGLHLYVLLDPSPAETRAATYGATAGSVALALMLLGYAISQRTLTARAWAAMRDRANKELERQVKARTAELLQAAKLATIGQMAAGIVHEVNQPLAAIRSFADNAGRYLERGEVDKVAANLHEIGGLVDRLGTITRRLKGFARRPAEQLEPVELAPAIERALALSKPRLDAARVAVELDPGPLGLKVMAEAVRLEQVLVNLFSNAAAAMAATEAERSLRVAVALAGGQVAVKVADTGPGIAPDALPHLFDPFFTTKPTGEGLGLGLSISSSIARDFGGRLEAANSPDGGAVFTLTLNGAGEA